MKRLIATLPIFLLLTGCEQTAADFAKKTNELLAEYQKRVQEQITETTAYYHQAGTLLGSETRRQTVDSLQTERNERSTELEADYRESRKPSSLYRTHLRDYANLHFEQQRQWLIGDLDASAPFLAQLVALEQDQATIDAFSKMLENLAKPRSARDELKDLSQFVGDSKTQLNTLLCGDITKQITALSVVPAGETPAALATRTAKLTAEKKLKSDQKCP